MFYVKWQSLNPFSKSCMHGMQSASLQVYQWWGLLGLIIKKFHDIMQEFQDISEISGHSGQILKFQEFQDNAGRPGLRRTNDKN